MWVGWVGEGRTFALRALNLVCQKRNIEYCVLTCSALIKEHSYGVRVLGGRSILKYTPKRH